MTQATDASAPLPSPTTSLAEELSRSRLSSGAASSSSSAPPAAPAASRIAFDDSDIPPSTSPGVYFCEVRVSRRMKEGGKVDDARAERTQGGKKQGRNQAKTHPLFSSSPLFPCSPGPARDLRRRLLFRRDLDVFLFRKQRPRHPLPHPRRPARLPLAPVGSHQDDCRRPGAVPQHRR